MKVKLALNYLCQLHACLVIPSFHREASSIIFPPNFLNPSILSYSLSNLNFQPWLPLTTLIFPNLLVHMSVDWCVGFPFIQLGTPGRLRDLRRRNVVWRVFLSFPFLSFTGIWISFWRIQSNRGLTNALIACCVCIKKCWSVTWVHLVCQVRILQKLRKHAGNTFAQTWETFWWELCQISKTIFGRAYEKLLYGNFEKF